MKTTAFSLTLLVCSACSAETCAENRASCTLESDLESDLTSLLQATGAHKPGVHRSPPEAGHATPAAPVAVSVIDRDVLDSVRHAVQEEVSWKDVFAPDAHKPGVHRSPPEAGHATSAASAAASVTDRDILDSVRHAVQEEVQPLRDDVEQLRSKVEQVDATSNFDEVENDGIAADGKAAGASGETPSSSQDDALLEDENAKDTATVDDKDISASPGFMGGPGPASWADAYGRPAASGPAVYNTVIPCVQCMEHANCGISDHPECVHCAQCMGFHTDEGGGAKWGEAINAKDEAER